MGHYPARKSKRTGLPLPATIHRPQSEAGHCRFEGTRSVMNKLEKMLANARTNGTWGEIIITLKNGKPILLKFTTQEKAEDYPANDQQRR
jgi:hypothetical protein